MSDDPTNEAGVVAQPAPNPTQGTPVWDLVMRDMKGRKRLGFERYGTHLRAFNGRNALIDAYQEALDLAVYLRQAIEEARGAPCPLPEETESVVVSRADIGGAMRPIVVEYLGDRVAIAQFTDGIGEHEISLTTREEIKAVMQALLRTLTTDNKREPHEPRLATTKRGTKDGQD